MAKKKVNISLPSVDELFTSQVERDSKGSSVIQLLPVASIVPFPNHPFGVRDDQDMEQLIESIQEHGILSPLTVRVASDGTFELISGHRRKHAAEKVGLADVPCIVKDLTDDEAVIAMVDSNLQRETILPSERAFAYSMRLEAMKRQGFRSDRTCAQVAHKLDGRKSRDILAEDPTIHPPYQSCSRTACPRGRGAHEDAASNSDQLPRKGRAAMAPRCDRLPSLHAITFPSC